MIVRERTLDLALIEFVVIVSFVGVVLVQDVAQLFAVGSARDRRVGAIVYERLLVLVTLVSVKARKTGGGVGGLVLVAKELVHSGGVVPTIGVNVFLVV
jgi:hypothetical protein